MPIDQGVNLPASLAGPPVRRRPYPAWPQAGERELELVREVLSGTRWFAGPRGDDEAALGTRFAASFAALHGARFGFAVANGSVAIEIALRALGVGPGDEVVVPAYTFVSTATSVLRVGAVPVFADIEPATYCLDPAVVERRLTPRTRTLLPVHLGGQVAAMEALTDIASRNGLHVIEDCAQAIGARRRGRMAGSWGAAGTFSFQSNKTITAGEGGLVLTSDPEFAREISAHRAFGRYQGAASLRRSSDVLSERLSTNFRLSELQAAVLVAQLERFQAQDELRQARAAQLARALAEIPSVRHVRDDAPDSRHGYYYFIVRYDPDAFAGMGPVAVSRALNDEGIPFIPGDARPVYRHPVFAPANLARDCLPDQLEHFQSVFDPDHPDCPAAEEACERTLILRHPVLLGESEDIDDVVTALGRVQARADEISAATSKEG